jgi:hypothetical protein
MYSKFPCRASTNRRSGGSGSVPSTRTVKRFDGFPLVNLKISLIFSFRSDIRDVSMENKVIALEDLKVFFSDGKGRRALTKGRL